ncbi:hypothetical protein MRX96_034657 [Rhipicephalus microplus]
MRAFLISSCDFRNSSDSFGIRNELFCKTCALRCWTTRAKEANPAEACLSCILSMVSSLVLDSHSAPSHWISLVNSALVWAWIRVSLTLLGGTLPGLWEFTLVVALAGPFFASFVGSLVFHGRG